VSHPRKWLVLAALVGVLFTPVLHAEKKTVCSITVNSHDEKELLRRRLPESDFQFVELVERGRPDWLSSACRKGVRCDALVISGHFDGGTEFYSDRLDVTEYLPVDEMERVACSDSCSTLFSQLKEVYLFGCNSLNAEGLRSTSAEIVRSLVRAGHSQADAEQLSRLLNERHADSNRDRMRRIFKDVPVIYGFSSKAPLGPYAASTLERYFQAGAGAEFASGRASGKLLGLFAPVSMTLASGLSDSDPQASYRRDVCHFFDDRLSSTRKLEFIHELLGRNMAEVRMFLDYIERYTASLSESDRRAPAVASALDAIAADAKARERYLEFMRDADQTAVRTRMIRVAGRLGWLSSAEQRAELMRTMGDMLASTALGSADVALACALNSDGHLTEDHRLLKWPSPQGGVSHAAVLACLGNPKAHASVLRALTSPKDDDVEIAQVYLHHRPIADSDELRSVAKDIAHMSGSNAQVRALDTLARYRLSDRESLEALTRLFALAKSIDVQRAIAGVLIRADHAAIASRDLAQSLRKSRLKSTGGHDVIDILIRRLEKS
jgi:hypothetical protein